MRLVRTLLVVRPSKLLNPLKKKSGPQKLLTRMVLFLLFVLYYSVDVYQPVIDVSVLISPLLWRIVYKKSHSFMIWTIASTLYPISLFKGLYRPSIVLLLYPAFRGLLRRIGTLGTAIRLTGIVLYLGLVVLFTLGMHQAFFFHYMKDMFTVAEPSQH